MAIVCPPAPSVQPALLCPDPLDIPTVWGPTAYDRANHLGYTLGIAGESDAEPTGDASESLRPFVAEAFCLGLDSGLLERQWDRERRDAERERYGFGEPADPGDNWHESEIRAAWGH